MSEDLWSSVIDQLAEFNVDREIVEALAREASDPEDLIRRVREVEIAKARRDADEGVNPKDAIGVKKAPLGLVSSLAIAHEAMAMKDGARKYGPYNWRNKKVRASIYVDAALRHVAAWFNGEELAGDSGAHHLGHARACLGILLDAMECDAMHDDRPPPAPMSELLERVQE